MPTSNLLIAFTALTLAIAGGCATAKRPPADGASPTAGRLVDDALDSLPRYDDPDLSPAHRRAIRVATTALHGADPSQELVDSLRFNLSENRDGYSVRVWRVESGKINPAGNFVTVNVGRDFRVVRIVGGA